jgi:hypothetical protein
VKRIAVLLSLLLAGCATKPPTTAPDWTELPPSIAEALCAKMRSEAVSSEATISVLKTTQPLVTPASIHSLGTIYPAVGKAAIVADAVIAGQKRLPINLAGTSCQWKPIDAVDTRSHDEMILQVSAPFVNPYARTEAGLFARLTLGGHDAQWYWVPLAQRKGVWAIGFVLPLDLHEG